MFKGVSLWPLKANVHWILTELGIDEPGFARFVFNLS